MKGFILPLVLVFSWSFQVLYGQSCDGADGLFPPLSGNTVIANGDICANSAVTPYRWEITYTNVDDGGNAASVQYFIDWNDGTTQTVSIGAGDNFIQQTGANSYRTVVTHLFPAGGADVQCEYTPTVWLQVNGTICPSTSQNPAPVVRWNVDDENTGVLELSEQATNNVIYEVCAGESVTVRFVDRSEFNCVPANFPGFPPNIRTRWFQFIYGGDPVNNTITGSNIAINTNTGSNPEGMGSVNLPAGITYSSQVVERLQPINAPTEFTFDITVPADASVGEEFAITLNNWNDCNRYQTGGVPTGNLPVQFTALIRIITSPPPPIYTPQEFCVNSPTILSVAPTSGGAINWYSDAALTNLIHTGASINAQIDPPLANRINNSIPGVYTYYATETLGNNCEGPAVNVTFQVYDNPTTANPGPDQTTCSTSVSLAANTPTVGSGTWLVVSGPGVVTNINAPTSTVTGLASATPTVLRWTITNGPCVSFDEVTIFNDAIPNPADAGPDQFECNISGATLSGNTPALGTGTWTQTNGPAVTITNPSNPNTTVTGLVGGNVYDFRWTISNGTCSPVFDEVSITTDLDPPANAGPDFSICPPANSSVLNADNPPIGTGVWSVLSGPGVVTNINQFNSPITNLTAQTILEWTVSNGVCVDVDQVIISIDNPPTVAIAGADDVICSDTYVLNGNAAASGNGIWTVISGSGIFSDEINPNSTVSGLALGPNILRWTISNACGSSSSDVTITNNQATSADAGLDQVICGVSTNLTANTPIVGTGFWSVISGDGLEVFTNINLESSGFQGTAGVTYVLQWNITNGVCPNTIDDAIIEFQQNPSISNAGTDQIACGNATVLSATLPLVGVGSWTEITGDGLGVFTNINSPTSGFSGTPGIAYQLEWSVSNGICAPSTSLVNIQLDPLPTTSNAGGDQVICGNAAILAANTPIIGTGIWQEFAGDGAGIFADATNPASNFIGTPGVNYQLTWTITSGSCPVSVDVVLINLEESPSIANAGADQEVCGVSTLLNASLPTVGTGQWTVVSGDIFGVFGNPNLNTSTFTGTFGVNYLLEWTVSNGTCTPSKSQVNILFNQNSTISNAGAQQDVCGGSTFLDANNAIIGVGNWTIEGVSDGLGVISNLTDSKSAFSGTPGQSYRLRWTISNGNCAPSISEVDINFSESPTISDAGTDQILCANSVNLSANSPIVGTGQWSFASNPDGNGVIADILDPNTLFTGTTGVDYVLQWTIFSGVCPPSSSLVTIEVGSAIPVPVITGPSQNCIGDISTYMVTGGNPGLYNYSWDISGLPTSTAVISGSGNPFQFINLEFLASGTGNLTVTISSKANGCVGATAVFPIQILQAPDMNLVVDDIDLVICQGETVTYTATDNNGMATRFDFILNGNVVQSGPSNSYITSALQAGNSMVVEGYSASCPSLPSAAITLTVNPLPFKYNVLGGGEICEGSAGLVIRLNNSNTGNTYRLYRDGIFTGELINSTGGQLLFPPQNLPGIYTVLAETANSCSLEMNGAAEIVVNLLPTVFDLTGGGAICEGDNGLIFSLNSSEIGVDYRLLKDGQPFLSVVVGTGSNIEFGPVKVDGTFQIEATNSKGCKVLMNGSGQVVVNPKPIINEINLTPEICSGEITDIQLFSDLSTSSFTWTVTYNPAEISGASDQLVPVLEGDFINQVLVNLGNSPSTVTYNVSANNGCESPVKAIKVIVNPQPGATIGGDIAICSGEDALITINATGSLPFDVDYWENGVLKTLNGLGNTHSFFVSPVINTTIIIEEIRDANGCSFNPVNQQVLIEVVSPKAQFTSQQPLESCSPYEITFENEMLDANYSYTWSWGDGSPKEVVNNQFVTHIFENTSTSVSRTYTITLTATFDNGMIICKDMMETQITIYPNVIPDVLPSNIAGCSPLTIDFSNNSKGATNHEWFYRLKGTNGQMGLTTEFEPQFIFSNTGNTPAIYEVVYTASNSNCSNSQIHEFTVYPQVTANFTVNGSVTPTPVVLSNAPHITIFPTIPAFSGFVYTWDYGDGNTSTGYNPITPYTYQDAGNYQITLKVEEPNGSCFDEFSVDIRIEPVIPIIDFSADPIAGCRPLVVNFTNESFGVNPGTYKWQIINSFGQVVASSNEENPTVTLYDPGQYSVRLSGENLLGTGASEFKENLIEVYNLPTASFLFRPATVFIPGGTLFTQNVSFGATDFEWDFGDGGTSNAFEPEHEYTRSGSFNIQLIAISQYGCRDTLVLANAVEVIEGGTFRIPNAFSPSLDGPSGGVAGGGTFNDVFLPILEGVTEFNMQIFDRWGNLLFESNDQDLGWDGYSKEGRLYPTGVYVYKLRLKFSKGEYFDKIGDLTLVR